MKEVFATKPEIYETEMYQSEITPDHNNLAVPESTFSFTPYCFENINQNYLSVPFSCVTRYCVGVSLSLSSSSVNVFSHGFDKFGLAAASSFFITGDSSSLTIRRIFMGPAYTLTAPEEVERMEKSLF
jgi:hypothetical protein